MKLKLILFLNLLLKDFFELITKQIKGIKMNTSKKAVYVMLFGKSISIMRGVFGKNC